MEQLLFSSVETLPNARASVTFTEPKPVFKEDGEVTPTILSDTHSYMPWGATNQMPFDIIDLIESDETLATCQMFNAEVCYDSGLVYDCAQASASVSAEVEDFLLDNDLASYFLGVCQDFKHFAFAVSVSILNTEGTKIVRLIRKEACYCRFAPAAASDTPTESIRTPSIIPSHNGKRDTSYHGINDAPQRRPDRPFLLETQWRDSASSQLHRPAVCSLATLCRHPKLQGACLRANPQNPPRLHFPHQRPRSFPLIMPSISPIFTNFVL